MHGFARIAGRGCDAGLPCWSRDSRPRRRTGLCPSSRSAPSSRSRCACCNPRMACGRCSTHRRWRLSIRGCRRGSCSTRPPTATRSSRPWAAAPSRGSTGTSTSSTWRRRSATFARLGPEENLVLACMEAEGLSWPGWRSRRAGEPRSDQEDRGRGHRRAPREGGATHGFRPQRWRQLPLGPSRRRSGDSRCRGSASSSSTPTTATTTGRATGTSSSPGCGDSPRNHLVVIAYDDREVTLKGKKVVGPTGGTFRACQRMLDRFGKDLEIEGSAERLRSRPFRPSAGASP